MQQISETTDRVQLDAAMKHLIVTGNALLVLREESPYVVSDGPLRHRPRWRR